MSSTSQVTTFSDLYTDLLNRVRVSSGVTTTDTIAKRYINIALQDMHMGEEYKFPWCEASTVMRTKAPYTTGTVSISVGSSTLTGSGTAWNTNDSYSAKNMVALGKVRISGETNIYKVSSVTNDTSAVLYTPYVGSAAVSGSAYTYFEDEYTLSTLFARPLDFSIFSPEMQIQLISRADFRRRYPVVNVAGRPRVACIVDERTSGLNLTPVRKVLFYPYPDQSYIIPYSYISTALAVDSSGNALTSMSSDSDTPIMPLRYRHAIVYHALASWYRDRKDDARSEAAKTEYNDIMLRIINDQDIATHNTFRLQPSNNYAAVAKRPYSYRGGRRIYDINSEFDSFRR